MGAASQTKMEMTEVFKQLELDWSIISDVYECVFRFFRTFEFQITLHAHSIYKEPEMEWNPEPSSRHCSSSQGVIRENH